MLAIKLRENGNNEAKVIVMMKLKKVVAIRRGNGGNKTEGSKFYKRLMILKKKILVEIMLPIVA